jgi:hypothetical protein
MFTKENNRAGIGRQNDIKRPALFGHYRCFDTEPVIINKKRQKMKQNDAKMGFQWYKMDQ